MLVAAFMLVAAIMLVAAFMSLPTVLKSQYSSTLMSYERPLDVIVLWTDQTFRAIPNSTGRLNTGRLNTGLLNTSLSNK